jgi:RNA-directed DNA polymerase
MQGDGCVSDIRDQQSLAAVPMKAKQAGEVRARWAWTEESVWTERMLTALENGVKGGVWFSLIDKVWSPANLQAAFTRVKTNGGGSGVDQITVAKFERDLNRHLERLSKELREGTYRPQAIRRAWIPKPGSRELRPLGIPTVRDRVVQTALRAVLEPIFERKFATHSYGFRPGRSCKDALRRVDALLKEGYTWVVDADLKSYFDTIPHARLMALVKEDVGDSRVLALIEGYLQQRILDRCQEWTPEAGSPQGAVISPLLSNLYLNPLDHYMEQRGYAMVRYADDFVVLCRSQEDAQRALEEVRNWTAQAGLVLHPDKTRLVDVTNDTFTFLGYTFNSAWHWPSDKSVRKLKEKLRPLTKRNQGESLRVIIAAVNPVLRGWFEYFKHGGKARRRRLDQWLRQRLRSLLRRRAKRKGMASGREHVEWPNHFFAAHGLQTLLTGHVVRSQSLKR